MFPKQINLISKNVKTSRLKLEKFAENIPYKKKT